MPLDSPRFGYPRKQQRPKHGLPQQQPASAAPAIKESPQPEHQKDVLGNRLLPLVEKCLLARCGNTTKARKITGMFLEMDCAEVLHLLADEPAVVAKVNEALHVLGLPS